MDEIQRLVARARGGERAAFGELYERLAPKLYGYLYHHTDRNATLAEDLVEDVFVKVMERLDRYEDRGTPFIGWVYRVASNQLIDYYRKQPKQVSVSVEDCHALPATHADRALDQEITRGELTRALGRLTGEQRQAVILRFLQGMSIAETAQAMGKTEDAVKKLQARGLGGLRRALGSDGLAALAA